MPRLIRLTCPACRTLIETAVKDEQRVTLLCAACHKQFTAKVPPKVAAARPAPTADAEPVAARPVLAPGRLADAVHDPLFDVPPADKIPVSPAAYRPPREYPPIDLRPVLVVVSSLIGMMLAIFMVLYAWHWVANTDWSTFSVIPDSHERLVDEWFEHNERTATENVKQMGQVVLDMDQAKRRVAEAGAWSEEMLVRAVRLGKAPLDKKAAYKERQEAFDKKMRSQLEAKLAELKASGKPPATMPDNSELMRQNPSIVQTMTLIFALPGYMGNALFDLPAPLNDTERIYYEEADLVHAYLKQLTMVRSTSQSVRVAEKIQELADKMMELAVKRSKMPANRFEQVPREYVSKDRGFEAAQKALIVRIRRDAQPDEKLKDAVANFNDARNFLIQASEGVSDVTLRSRFAEARKVRGESSKRLPGDLFMDAAPETTQDSGQRELVIKPRRQSQPDPLLDPPKIEAKPTVVEARPQPVSESVVNSPPATIQTQTQTQLPTSSATSSGTGPMPGAERATAGEALMPGNKSFGAQTDAGPTPGTQAFNGQPQGNMPYGGQPGMPFGGRPFGGQPPGGQPPGGQIPGGQPPGGPPPMPTAESVKIVITSQRLGGADGDKLVRRLASQLESSTYRMNASNGKINLQIQYRGDLDRVISLIDFGQVTVIDKLERTIHVVAQ